MKIHYWLLIISFALIGCTSEQQLESECIVNSDCELPMQYAIQSNCPFRAVCLENTCEVICPIASASSSELLICETDQDCDCSHRADNSKDCVCLDGICASVE